MRFGFFYAVSNNHRTFQMQPKHVSLEMGKACSQIVDDYVSSFFPHPPTLFRMYSSNIDITFICVLVWFPCCIFVLVFFCFNLLGSVPIMMKRCTLHDNGDDNLCIPACNNVETKNFECGVLGDLFLH